LIIDASVVSSITIIPQRLAVIITITIDVKGVLTSEGLVVIEIVVNTIILIRSYFTSLTLEVLISLLHLYGFLDFNQRFILKFLLFTISSNLLITDQVIPM